MKAKINNLNPWIALIILAGLEIFIRRPEWWAIHFVILGLILLLARVQTKSFKIKGFYRAVFFILVPGLGFIFFIDVALWQHLFIVMLSFLVAYLFYRVTDFLRAPAKFINLAIFPLSNIFFAISLASGLHIFFRITYLFSAGVMILCVALFPAALAVSRRKETRERLSLPGISDSQRIIYFWFRNESNAKIFRSPSLVFRLMQRSIKLQFIMGQAKVFLLFVIVEIFLIIASLPVNVVVGASIGTLAIFSIFSLLNYSQVEKLNRTAVVRYVGAGLLLMGSILVTAQWS